MNREIKKQLEGIAIKNIVGLSTLETRNSDDLDFHNVSVWSLKKALIESYRRGLGRISKSDESIEKKTENVAKESFVTIKTLTEQKSDSLDFHNIAVWNLKDALIKSYKLGVEDKMGNDKNRIYFIDAKHFNSKGEEVEQYKKSYRLNDYLLTVERQPNGKYAVSIWNTFLEAGQKNANTWGYPIKKFRFDTDLEFDEVIKNGNHKYYLFNYRDKKKDVPSTLKFYIKDDFLILKFEKNLNSESEVMVISPKENQLMKNISLEFIEDNIPSRVEFFPNNAKLLKVLQNYSKHEVSNLVVKDKHIKFRNKTTNPISIVEYKLMPNYEILKRVYPKHEEKNKKYKWENINDSLSFSEEEQIIIDKAKSKKYNHKDWYKGQNKNVFEVMKHFVSKQNSFYLDISTRFKYRDLVELGYKGPNRLDRGEAVNWLIKNEHYNKLFIRYGGKEGGSDKGVLKIKTYLILKKHLF